MKVTYLILFSLLNVLIFRSETYFFVFVFSCIQYNIGWNNSMKQPTMTEFERV